MDWWASESAISATARRSEPELTRLCDVSQGLIAELLGSPVVAAAASDSDRAAVLATNQAFNCLRSAWALAFAGYSAQALALTRLAHEYHVVLRYSQDHPEGIADVFDPASKTGKLAQKMREEEAVLDRLHVMRGSLNMFAHQSSIGLNMAIRPDKEGRDALHLGPFVDPEILREVAYEVLVCSTLVIAELIRWQGASDPEWATRAVMFSDDVSCWLRTVREPPAQGS